MLCISLSGEKGGLFASANGGWLIPLCWNIGKRAVVRLTLIQVFPEMRPLCLRFTRGKRNILFYKDKNAKDN